MLSHNEIQDLMRYVYCLAERSTDLSTKNAAILINETEWPLDKHTILAEGFNAHLPGFENIPGAHDRPLKYSLTEHAERACIYNAAYRGVCTRGLTMIANWVFCPDCARGVALPGLRRVYTHQQCMDRTPERWSEMVDLGVRMAEENTFSPLEVVRWDGVVGGVKNLNNGEIWTP